MSLYLTALKQIEKFSISGKLNSSKCRIEHFNNSKRKLFVF